MFAKCKQVTTTAKVSKKQTYLSNLHIRCLVLDHPKVKRRRRENLSRGDEIIFLNHRARNKFICKLAISREGNTLVLCSIYSTVRCILYEMNIDDEDRKVFFVYGATDTEDRDNIRGIVERKIMRIIVRLMEYSLWVLISKDCITLYLVVLINLRLKYYNL